MVVKPDISPHPLLSLSTFQKKVPRMTCALQEEKVVGRGINYITRRYITFTLSTIIHTIIIVTE
jgi:hypothetical protein